MNELIYNQHEIPRKQWRYGFRSSAATGCGWIAVYNALLLMGDYESPESLIRYFAWQVPLINGNFGTILYSPIRFFKKRGYRVKVSVRRKKFDEMVRNSDAAILFYYWRRQWKIGSHFVTVRYEDGKYIGYNTYRNSKGPDDWGSNLETVLKKRRHFGTVLIAIREEKKDDY